MPNTCLNNNHLPDQFYVLTSSDFWTIVLLTLLRMCSKGQRILFARFIVENRDNIWCNLKKEMNEKHINLALIIFNFFVRFIIFLINANLTNSSWTPLPKAKKKNQNNNSPPKKTVLYIVHLIIFYTSTETPIYFTMEVSSSINEMRYLNAIS